MADAQQDDDQKTVSGESTGEVGDDEEDLAPFSTKTNINDTALVVEGKKLYVSKHVLSLASPVFRAMFESDMAEKNMDEIPLPGKRLSDMRAFMLCVYPDTREPITVWNAGDLVPLFTEYQVNNLRDACDETLAKSCAEDTDIDTLFEHLLLSSTYNMRVLRRRCIQIASTRNTDTLRKALRNYALPCNVTSELWENVTEKRESNIQSLIDMCELLPSTLKTSVARDVNYTRNITVTFEVADRQVKTRQEVAKYISAIQTANGLKLHGMKTILLDSFSSQLKLKNPINTIICTKYMTENEKAILFGQLCSTSMLLCDMGNSL